MWWSCIIMQFLCWWDCLWVMVSSCTARNEWYHHALRVMYGIIMHYVWCMVSYCNAFDDQVSSCTTCDVWYHHVLHVMIRYHHTRLVTQPSGTKGKELVVPTWIYSSVHKLPPCRDHRQFRDLGQQCMGSHQNPLRGSVLHQTWCGSLKPVGFLQSR